MQKGHSGTSMRVTESPARKRRRAGARRREERAWAARSGPVTVRVVSSQVVVSGEGEGRENPHLGDRRDVGAGGGAETVAGDPAPSPVPAPSNGPGIVQ